MWKLVPALLIALVLRHIPGLNYSSNSYIYIDRVAESQTRIPRNGYIQELTVLKSTQVGSVVAADGQVLELASTLPPGSTWRGVQVKDFKVVKKEFVEGSKEVCLEHLYMDVRSGAVTNGVDYVVNPAGEMTGWASIRRCHGR